MTASASTSRSASVAWGTFAAGPPRWAEEWTSSVHPSRDAHRLVGAAFRRFRAGFRSLCMIRCDKDLGPCRIFASARRSNNGARRRRARGAGGNSAWNSLDTASIGRVVFTDGGLPVVLPVTFVLDGDAVVFRTRAGWLAGITSGSVLAFEVDDAELALRVGWSVTVCGQAAVGPFRKTSSVGSRLGRRGA